MFIDFRQRGGGGKEPVIEALSVTANGKYEVPEGTDGYSPVDVNVPDPELQEKTVVENGDVLPDQGIYGLSKVTVNVPIPTFETEELTATENKVYTPAKDGYSKVTVNVPAPVINLQEKSTTRNGSVTPDEGYDGLSKVDVNVPQEGGVVKPRILNGTRFSAVNGDCYNNFNVEDYDWTDFDNIGKVFSDNILDTKKYIYQDLFNECKRLQTKIKVISISINYDLDLRGLDLSECYRIEIFFSGEAAFHNINIDLSGCDLSNVETFEIRKSDYFEGDINVNLTGCTFKYLTRFGVKGTVQGFNDINFSNCLYMPYCWNDDIDFSNADLHNVKFLDYGYPLLPNTIYPVEKIDIFSFMPEFKIKNITSLDLSQFNFKNVSFFRDLLWEVDGITEIKGLSEVRSPYSIFRSFSDMKNLKKIDISGINMLGTKDVSGFLSNDPELTDVKFPYNIQEAFNLSGSPLLSKESLLSLIQGLYDFGPDGGKSFTIGAENLAKLTAEEIAVASGKGWTLQ